MTGKVAQLSERPQLAVRNVEIIGPPEKDELKSGKAL